jgi:putative endonuclease
MNNNKYYIGSTSDLKRRYKEHVSGQERTTKKFQPIKLTTYLGSSNKTLALKFEKYLKSGSGLAFRKRHLV